MAPNRYFVVAIRRTRTGRSIVSRNSNDRTGLECTQQQGLNLGRQLADFVEKKRALMKRLEGANVRVNGTRERALPVPEEFRCERWSGLVLHS